MPPTIGTDGYYHAFLASKRLLVPSYGINLEGRVPHPLLFPFQRDLVAWSLRKGRAAVWADTGLGKTLIQVEWARLMGENTLIVAPLSVARQTVREARKIDAEVRYVRDQAEVSRRGIWITNYEMVESFDPDRFGAVVLDESGILKALTGVTRTRLIRMFGGTPYRLCCTATPAPNDYTELGNHAEFLGICTTQEMLATWFVNANKQHAFLVGDQLVEKKGSNKGGTEWRLKHHAEDAFFRWLSSWAISLRRPSDLGYDDDGFVLPPLYITPVFVSTDYRPADQLFFTRLGGLGDRVNVRRATLAARLDQLRRVVDATGPSEQWIVWVGLDEEGRTATAALPDAREVRGNHSPDEKAEAFESFQDGRYRVLVTKARIGGFGMNFQNAHHMAFIGLGDSWEQYYQCIRRQWRYGQAHPVHVHVIMSDVEREIWDNVQRKDALAIRLREKLIAAVREHERGELGLTAARLEETYREDEARGDGWRMMLGDSCQRLRELPDGSVALSVHSPPFEDLFTYSASERDLGNSKNRAEFFRHYGFIIRDLLRATMPGRIACVHTSDIPAMASRDGWIGLKDFPGEVIRAYEREGWTFVGRAYVQKNPQSQAIRVKSKALLFVQLRKDSADCRPALVDQVLLFRRPGDNPVPVRPVENGEMDNETWIEWANGIWLGIHESDTLSYTNARGAEDEKHICPLQLGTIERCLKLYSNPGELVLDPFAGIGSTGYEALRSRRRFVGIELKPEYHRMAVRNLQEAERLARRPTLFDGLMVEPNSG